jgi:transcription initiation factor TFIID TATA-box-binding protein
MVTKADLCQKLDLERVSALIPESNYEPKRFSGLFYKLRNPRITFVVFNSGKVIGYGGQSLEDVRLQFNKLLSALSQFGVEESRIKRPEISMLVGSANIQRLLDMETLARKIPRIIYEPEQFPGLMWHFSESEVIMVFSSGRIIITGAKSVERLNQVYDEASATLQSGTLD